MSTLHAHLATFQSRFGKELFQLAVIAALFATGLWGHKHHWQFSSWQADSELGHATHRAIPPTALDIVPRPDEHAVAPGEISPALAHIKFPSVKSIRDLGIQVEPAEYRPLTRTISAPANVVYERSRYAQLSVRVSGTVWRVERFLGQTVKAGDVLAIIDSPALGKAKADFLHSIADVELCQKVYEPLQSFAHGEVSVKQIRAAETELRKAKVDLFNAHQALVSLGLPIDVNECQKLPEAELEKRVKFLVLGESLIARLDPETTSASLLPIHAPFDGIVIGRDVSIGEVVSPEETSFEVADLSKMWVLLNVREQDSSDLELGQSVTFTAGSASAAGKISWMSTAVDPKTRTVEVRCEVDNPEILTESGEPTGKRLLRANLFGIGKIELARNPLALSVPTKAVQWDGEAHVVFVQVDPESFEPRRVRLGILGDKYSEVIDQLSVHDPVAVEGSHILKAELSRMAMAKPP